ncbi:HupE/UreJ family protein [Notoacmeibacter ruber]|uniref:Protein hupE n=1 Tax=Notoacmeibacter ruber TaxID=2670375 RepID=A0A3L7JIV1_9HYPH|nr:HupE/UreJ family protein [Notoacmeibacter ruber]RLQ88412.1 protein hupE [Notoacmeibacter ruber]
MRRFVLATIFGLASAPAFAHAPTGAGATFGASFMSGALHPLNGLDHILAMVAVGIFAAMIGGRAIFAIPASFIGAMVIGFVLATAGLSLPMVEPMIVASVIVFGLLIAATTPSSAIGMGLALLFGLFHGHAHGAELAGATATAFGAGFMVGTALLHAAGIALAVGLEKMASNRAILRVVGGATALAGVAIGFGF